MSARNHARVIVAMVTPFAGDGRVCMDGARRLSSRLVDDGADGILVSGTTGESPTLDATEKTQLLEVILEEVGDRAEVWMGSGTNDTRTTVALTRQAGRSGADGVMLVTPYYNRPTQEGMYEHFRLAAEESSCPVMLYNVPSRTGGNLLPDTVARLARLDNVVAVKEASGDIDQVARIRAVTPEDFLIYSGDDSMTLPVMSVGGWGVVSVAAHLVAGRIAAMIDDYRRGMTERAARAHVKMLPLLEVLTIRTNPIPVKTAVSMCGPDVGGFRPPLTCLDNEGREQLQSVLQSMGLMRT